LPKQPNPGKYTNLVYLKHLASWQHVQSSQSSQKTVYIIYVSKAAKKNKLKIFLAICTLYCADLYLCISQNKKANIMETVIFIAAVIAIVLLITVIATKANTSNPHNDVY
jgi:uncharacterized membrane protein